MGLRETLAEIRERHTHVMDGPEVAGVGRFYSAATIDVGSLLDILDVVIDGDSDELHQAELAALLAVIDTLTSDLATLGSEHSELQVKYQRIVDYLDGLPPLRADGGGAEPRGGD